tara:strand:- start:6858 stop:9623 length:2766 start_codon:yes stop_codon:yes gene_type:complete
MLCIILLLSVKILCQASEPIVPSETESQLKTAVSQLHAAQKNVTPNQATLKTRVREVTWRLLVGEISASPSVGLISSSYDALEKGLSDLDKLMTDIETTPELEQELAENPQIAVRLDTAQIRLSEVAEKKQITRSEELARLTQLRDINRAYRALLKHLIAGQTEALLGQPAVVAAQGELVLKQFQNVEETVSKRRDYYLFEDEPSLDQPAEELNLIKEIAAPYAKDVLHHEQALLALALVNLATKTKHPNKEILDAALVQADAAVEGIPNPDSIACYTRGLCRLELGRLITSSDPFNQQLHSQALEWFQKAKEDLTKAKAALPPTAKQSDLISKIDRYLQELNGAPYFHSQASQLIEKENSAAAIEALFRGTTLHRTPSLALAWIEARWRSGEIRFDEFSKLAASTLSEGLLKDNDIEFLSLQGRVEVLHAWGLVSDIPDTVSFKDRRKQTQKVLLAGRSDLMKAIQQPDTTPELKRRLKGFYALSEAMLILIDSGHDPASARTVLGEIPVLVRELENDLSKAEGTILYNLLEAVQLTRLAEAYLTLRLLPDSTVRARAAFASAMDAATKLPGQSHNLQPSGAATLRAMLFRDDGNENRVAQEERQLRSALQKILPALVSVSVGDPEKIAETLTASLTEVQQDEPAWDPRKQLDARDINGARDGVVTDLRAVTVLSMVSANQPASALQTMLLKWYPSLRILKLDQINWIEVRTKYSESSDPLSSYALGAAIEEYAVVELNQDHSLRPMLLKEALACYEHSNKLISESILWRERWPYLEKLTIAGKNRLIDEKTALKIAISLRARLHIQEARETLQNSLKRHPESVLIREELIATLMDEAMLTPKNKSNILTQALDQLEQAKQKDGHLSAGSLVMLGDLQEQFARWDAATDSYRKLSALTNDRALKIKAESRLAIIMARTAE